MKTMKTRQWLIVVCCALAGMGLSFAWQVRQTPFGSGADLSFVAALVVGFVAGTGVGLGFVTLFRPRAKQKSRGVVRMQSADIPRFELASLASERDDSVYAPVDAAAPSQAEKSSVFSAAVQQTEPKQPLAPSEPLPSEPLPSELPPTVSTPVKPSVAVPIPAHPLSAWQPAAPVSDELVSSASIVSSAEVATKPLQREPSTTAARVESMLPATVAPVAAFGARVSDTAASAEPEPPTVAVTPGRAPVDVEPVLPAFVTSKQGEPDLGLDAERESGDDLQAESEMERQSEAESERESDFGLDAEREPEPERESEIERQSEAESECESDLGLDAERESEREPEPERESDLQPEPRSEPEPVRARSTPRQQLAKSRRRRPATASERRAAALIPTWAERNL